MASFLEDAKGKTVVEVAARISHDYDIEFHKVLTGILRVTDLWNQYEDLRNFKEIVDTLQIKVVVRQPPEFDSPEWATPEAYIGPLVGVVFEDTLFKPSQLVFNSDGYATIPLRSFIAQVSRAENEKP